MRYRAASRMASLTLEWVSQASATQRRGRAGRVCAGRAYHLWPRSLSLAVQHTAEMLRSPLEELLLQAALLGAASPAAFLARAPTPPLAADADAATRNLLELGAFAPATPPPGANPNQPPPALLAGGGGGKVQLTPLGLQLACLPLDPRLGKLLLLSCLCGVLEQARSYP